MKAKGSRMQRVMLPCVLTEEERASRSMGLANEIEIRAQSDLDRKSAMADFKDKIAGHDSLISRLSSIVRSGKEYREVECEDIPNHERKVWDRIRQDTGELVQSYAMTDQDRQLSIDDAKSTDAKE